MKTAARFSGFLAFIVLMFCVSNVQAQDYVLAFSDRYSWRVDLLPCTSCGEIIRFNHNYVMYIFNENMLYVLPPDGSAPAVFDIGIAVDHIVDNMIPMTVNHIMDDMIPFEDGTILFMTIPIIGSGLESGKQLLLYETQSQNLRFLDKTLADHQWDCGPHIPQPNYLYIHTHSMQRLGLEKAVIICLRDVIDILNVETAALENHMTFNPRCGGECVGPSWQNLIGGHDGRLYLYNTTFPEIEFPPDYNLKQYDPETGEWSAHLVPREIFDRAAAHENTDSNFTWPIEVDEDGNIYFQFLFIDNKPRGDGLKKTDFVKTDATGQVIWHFTESDLPDEPILFLDNDLFVAMDTGRLLQVMPIPASTSSG